jgi:hypothetical protein
MKEMIMTTQQSNSLTAEVLPQQASRRRLALGRGLGELLLHTQLRRAGHRARALREEPLPRGMPSWARGFYHKVCRLGRKV